MSWHGGAKARTKIAIIGAGPAGLTASRACTTGQEHLRATVEAFQSIQPLQMRNARFFSGYGNLFRRRRLQEGRLCARCCAAAASTVMRRGAVRMRLVYLSQNTLSLIKGGSSMKNLWLWLGVAAAVVVAWEAQGYQLVRKAQ